MPDPTSWYRTADHRVMMRIAAVPTINVYLSISLILFRVPGIQAGMRRAVD